MAPGAADVAGSGSSETAVLIDVHNSLVRGRQRRKLELREWKLLPKATQLENNRDGTGTHQPQSGTLLLIRGLFSDRCPESGWLHIRSLRQRSGFLMLRLPPEQFGPIPRGGTGGAGGP